MTEQSVPQKDTPKSKVLGVVRWVFLGAMLALLLFTIIMAAYRKFAG
jgi:hypothetical protein